MRRHTIVITLLLTFASLSGNSQRSEYVERASRSPFYLRTGIQAMPFIFTPSGFGNINQSTFKHNQNFVAGFGGAFEKTGFNLTLNLPVNVIDDQYANSRFRGLYLGLAGRRRLLELSFRRNLGYSDAGISSYDPTFQPTDEYPERDDIQLTQFNVNHSRFFNTNYSYKAAYSFNAIQKKSAGSFFMYKHFRYQRIKADAPFLNSIVWPEYGEFGTIDQLRFWSVGVSPGIAGTAVFNGLYVSGLASLGFSAQYQKYRIQSEKKNRITFAPSTAAKFAFGYNGEKMFIAFTNAVEFNFSRLPGVLHSTYYYSSYFNLGLRW